MLTDVNPAHMPQSAIRLTTIDTKTAHPGLGRVGRHGQDVERVQEGAHRDALPQLGRAGRGLPPRREGGPCLCFRLLSCVYIHTQINTFDRPLTVWAHSFPARIHTYICAHIPTDRLT